MLNTRATTPPKIKPAFQSEKTAPSLNETIRYAETALLSMQSEEGYWQFELESDCSISVEYALMMFFMDDVDELVLHKIARYLRGYQSDEGGFSLFPGGPDDVSLATKAYYVLKLTGDSIDASHMVKARNSILSHGGASKCNVLTRILLATFGQLPWRGTPFVPVELMFLPHWFPVNIYTLSYWARTVVIPLSVLSTQQPKAKNTRNIDIAELFVIPPDEEQHYFDDSSWSKKLFLMTDRLGQILEPLMPKWIRNRAMKKAELWIKERLNGEDGLGALMPAMLYAYEAMDAMGTAADDPDMIKAKKAMQRLLVINSHEAYCQPAFSPVWDTAFAMLALQEGMTSKEPEANRKAAEWLASKQLGNEPGDWRVKRPNFKGGGGWAFQFNSAHYPDIDDTGIVALAIFKNERAGFDSVLEKAARWLQVMQSKNGGFAAYDVDNTSQFVDASPLADYISLIDPPTSDVSARCVAFLANMVKNYPEYQQTVDKAINFLWQEQEEDGSWFGRWGCNYIYGTWSVLFAMDQAKVSHNDPRIQKAVKWLKSVQGIDGGWGEDNMTYHASDFRHRERYVTSTAFQTAWALLGLMSAGEVNSPEVKGGIQYLQSMQQENGLWRDFNFSGAGFPKAVYLKYHGYEAYFPLWALAKYRNLKNNVGFFH